MLTKKGWKIAFLTEESIITWISFWFVYKSKGIQEPIIGVKDKENEFREGTRKMQGEYASISQIRDRISEQEGGDIKISDREEEQVDRIEIKSNKKDSRTLIFSLT